MSDNAPTEAEERAFSDAMDADRMPSATVEYWVYAAALHERDAALALAERRAGEIARLQEEQARMRRQFRFIRQDAASPLRRQTPATTFDGIVELCDAALAAETPPASEGEDAGGGAVKSYSAGGAASSTGGGGRGAPN